MDTFDGSFYKKLLNQINTNIYITDVETDEIVYMNDYMKQTFQLQDVEGQICWRVLQSGMDGRCDFCKVRQLQEGKNGSSCLWREKNTVTGRVYMNYDFLQRWNGRLYHIQNSNDITDQVQLSMEASIDELTGVLNRSAGKKYLEDMLQAVDENDKFTVALCDINGLKWVNDTYGHLEGDRLLVFVARNIKKELDQDDFIFRLSGDEFIVVFRNKNMAEADRWMQAMLRKLDARRAAGGIAYDVTFSYGMASIYRGEHLSVSDVLSIADTQMYIQKRDYHIMRGKRRLEQERVRVAETLPFQYNKDNLFDAFAESIDDYAFVGNLKTGEFLYSYKMKHDFGLPSQVLGNAAAFWAEKIHPDDAMTFLRSNQEIADGRAERHTVAYRAMDINGEWVPLLCRGKMVRDESGTPDLFAGVIRRLDRGLLPEGKEFHGASTRTILGLSELETFILTSVYQDLEEDQRAVFFDPEQKASEDESFYFLNETGGRERFRAELRLLKFVNRNLPGGIMAVYEEPDFPLFCFNKAILEYTGYSYEEMMDISGGCFGRLIEPEDRDMVAREVRKQLSSKPVYEIRYRLRCKDMRIVWVYERGRRVRTEQDRDLILSFFVDISQEVESEIELGFITRHSMDGVFKAEMREGFPLLYANEGYYRIHGYSREQLKEEKNNCADTLVYEPDRAAVEQKIADLIRRQDRQVVLEYRIVRRDGSLAWVHVDAGLGTLDSGQIVMTGMVMDITERRELEERLRQTERLFQVARSRSRLNMWEYSIAGRTIRQTRESMEVHGFGETVEDVPESIIAAGVVHPDSVAAVRKLYERVQAGEREVTDIIRLKVRGRENEYWWEKVTYISIPDADGTCTQAIGISEDVTAQKEAELRVFQEDNMRKRMTDMLYSFRLNVTRNVLEECWSYTGESWNCDAAEDGFAAIRTWLSGLISQEDDRKRFGEQFCVERIVGYAKRHESIPELEFRQEYANGLMIWVALELRMVPSPTSGDWFLFGYVRNIDLLKKRELSLQQKAETDEVTGFYNHTTIELLAQNILKSGDETGRVKGLLLLDIDNFKLANRMGGLLTGDRILKLIADEIRGQIPASSVAGRLNGDVFLVFLYNLHTEKEALMAAEKIRRALCKTYSTRECRLELTASAGLVCNFSQGITFDQLYQCALHALDTAKRSGRNRLVSYNELEEVLSGLDLEILIDLEDYHIINMNATGLITFGFTSLMEADMKCYELLHNRTEPCPFCHKKLCFEKSKTWECYVSRLNRLLYVQERLTLYDGSRVRQIRLSENSFEAFQSADEREFFSILEEGLSGLEKGGDKQQMLSSFLDYLGGYYRAFSVRFFERGQTDGPLAPALEWNVNGLTKQEQIPMGDPGFLETALSQIWPQNSLVVSEESEEAVPDGIRAYYGGNPLPGTVMLNGHYENGTLIGCLLLEQVHQNEEWMKPLELVSSYIRRMRSVCRLRENYDFMANHDQKTGLLNYDAYVRYLADANEDVFSALGMAGVHIVNLRSYNQKYGKFRGDELLRTIAGSMTEIFEKSKCFRLSGAGFIILCPDMSYEQVTERLSRLDGRLEEICPGWAVTACVWEHTAISMERLQIQLEEKIQLAVQKILRQKTGESERAVDDIREGLLAAIGAGEFCTYLQPKASVSSGAICGAEALVRYFHKEKGIIPPGRFLPVIEKAGLIRHVDLFVLKDVCRIQKEWTAAGYEPYPISLNYSRATILEPGILEETNRIVDDAGISRHLIEIEVTESIGSIDNIGLKQIVNQFVEAGYPVAMDDFGAEYSNIYTLYSLKLEALKLDRRIVSDIYHDARARLVVGNVIDVCKKLGITSVAEGVETGEQLDVLKELCCDVAQGYYFNKPLSQAEYEHLYWKKP